MGLRDEAIADAVKPGYTAGINKLLADFPEGVVDQDGEPITVDDVRCLLMDPDVGHAKVFRILNRYFGDDPAFARAALSGNMVADWRRDRGVRIR